MQKQISKQSLAIVALSIILAISMALTATFAAFSATNTVSGTISFTNGDLSITVAGTNMQSASNGVQVAVANNAITITLTDDAFEFSFRSDTGFLLTDEAREILDDYTITISSSGSKAYYWNISKGDSGANNNVQLADTTSGVVQPVNSVTSDTVLSLMDSSGENNIINDIVIVESDSDFTAESFTITIDASYNDIRS